MDSTEPLGWGAAGGAWLLTYLIHSTVLLGAAWIVAHLALRGREGLADPIWKLAVVGGLLTATLQGALDLRPLGGRHPVGRRVRIIQQEYYIGHRQRPVEFAEDPRSRAVDPLPQLVPAHGGTGPWLAALWMLWAVVAAGRVARRVREHRRAMRALAARRELDDAALAAELADLARRAQLASLPRLTVASGLAVPVAIGRGEVCLPARAVAELSAAELRGVIAHEVAHLARRDPLWLWALTVVREACFLQPLNAVALRGFTEGAEFLCDAWAAEATGRPKALARSLATVAEWIAASPPVATLAAMSERRSPLTRRVERLLYGGNNMTVERQLSGRMALVAAFVTLLTAWAVPRVVPPGERKLILKAERILLLTPPKQPADSGSAGNSR